MVSEDVEMKDVKTPDLNQAESEQNSNKDKNVITLEDIREQGKQVERGVTCKEPRYICRVLRAVPAIRRRLNGCVLHRLVVTAYTHSTESRDSLLSFVATPSDAAEDTTSSFRMRSTRGCMSPLLPEQDTYFCLLLLLFLLDDKQYESACRLADIMIDKLRKQNRRSLDPIAAKFYFYYMRSYELTGNIQQIKGVLHERLRVSTLRADTEGQAVLINCLLRASLASRLYDQAALIVAKCHFPAASSSGAECARYLYYMARVKAARLEYTAACDHARQALRKAPQNTAVGFKQAVQKLLVTVQLLMGDIPPRQVFLQPQMRRALAAYYQLAAAVRSGSLARFTQCVTDPASCARFADDHLLVLVLRMRTNVIKTAVRAMSLSYSRISLQDVANKLQLDSVDDVEFIVAKAIRDGVVEASIDHEAGEVRSNQMLDVYCTREPCLAYHTRINFCLDLYKRSTKAMRFPANSYNKQLETSEERRLRERQDLELANEIAEEENDDEGFL